MEEKSFTFTLSGPATTALTMILMGLEEAENQPVETRAAAAFVADEIHPQLTEMVPQMVEELDEYVEKNGDKLDDEQREILAEMRSGALQRYEELQFRKASGDGEEIPSEVLNIPPEKMI